MNVELESCTTLFTQEFTIDMKYKDNMQEGYLDSNQEYWDYGTSPITGNNIVDTRKTGISFYDQFLNPSDAKYMEEEKNLKGEIVKMSPQEYYEECAKYMWPGRNVTVDKLKYERGVLGAKTIEKLKNVLLKYKLKLCMPMINYVDPGQEGLHRMYVIGELYGWDFKVPVLKVTYADEDRAKRIAEEKRKQEIDWKVESAIQSALRYEYGDVEEFEAQLQWALSDKFRFWDEIKIPDEIKLIETTNSVILPFEGYEYPIEKGEILWKEPEFEPDDEIEDLIDESDLEETDEILKKYFGDDWRETHPHLKDTFGIKEEYESKGNFGVGILTKEFLIVEPILTEVRKEMIDKYGEDFLYGKCIEASDRIVELLSQKGIEASTIEGWVHYDFDEGCSDRPYDEHTWVETSSHLICDVTATQFNAFMEEDYPEIICQYKLPHGFQYSETILLESASELTVVGTGIQLRKDLEKGWTKETCHPSYRDKWSIELPSIGQCAITAMYLNEIMGWDIYETLIGKSRHFFNKDSNGFIYDLTSDQFSDNDINYEFSRKREFKDLYKSCKNRYELFKSNLKGNIQDEKIN